MNFRDTFFFFWPFPRICCFFIPWGGFLTACKAGFFWVAAGFLTGTATGLVAGLGWEVAVGLAGAVTGLAAAAVVCFFWGAVVAAVAGRLLAGAPAAGVPFLAAAWVGAAAAFFVAAAGAAAAAGFLVDEAVDGAFEAAGLAAPEPAAELFFPAAGAGAFLATLKKGQFGNTIYNN